MPSAPDPAVDANPSFVVLQLKPGVDPQAIDKLLQAQVKGGAGTLLVPLDDNWYAVSRGAGKELRVTAGGTNDLLVDFIANLTGDGVTGVGLIPANQMVQRYQASQTHRLSAPAFVAPIANLQWNLDNVRAREAWALFGGWDRIKWGSIRVGHLDTGYTQHPAFGPWVNNHSPSLLPQDGANFFDNGPGPADPLPESGTPGHGTRTSSVLTGYDPAVPGNAQGFFGIAPRVPVVPYRVTDFVVIDTLWWQNQIGKAIDHAVFNAGCSVISISLGDPCYAPSEMGAAVDRAYEQGVIFVAAAGNYTSEVTYPGRYSRAIAAGGITPTDEPWNGGSRGISVTVSAPADLIYRADWVRDAAGTPTPVYGNMSGGSNANGTSYATVHVSGAAALWLAHHNSALDQYRAKPWQIVEAFRTVLRSSARKPANWNDKLFGAGILDIEALLKADLPSPGDLVYMSPPAAGQHS